MILSKKVLINKPTGKYFKYYQNLGYILNSNLIEVDISHLSLGSKTKIEVSCDYCGLIKKIPYCDYNKTTKYNTLKYACKNCGSLKQKNMCLEKNGVLNYFQIDSVKNSIKQTNLEKYGVDNYTKTDEYKEKTKKTNLERYGVENVSQSDIIKSKVRLTNQEKYGVDSYTKTDEYKEKAKKTNLEKYGVDSYTKTDEYKEKTKKTNLEKYGVEHFQSTDEWKKKIKEVSLLKYKVDHVSKSEYVRGNYLIGKNNNYIKYLSNRISLFKCNEYDHEFEISYDNYKSRTINDVKLCTICHPIGDSQSIKEKELFNYIKSVYNGEIIQSYRDGMEIDIYLPDLKIGFEFNGLYWHSELYRDKWYHINKTNYFKGKGTRIIHIWEDDWDNKKEIIKSQINNWLGLTENKIFARKCHIKEVNLVESKDFLNKNHIQGSVNSVLKLGLYYDNELVSLMTFDHFEGRKKMEDNGWNLSRFCNKLNTNVVGGASRLLNYFINNYNPTRIVSYADKDWSTGNLYYELGFTNINESKPDYKYIIDNKRIHKSRFRKSKTGISESKLNMYKLWDCGKIKYEKKI